MPSISDLISDGTSIPRVRWEHPLAKDLHMCCINLNGLMFDLVSNTILTPFTSAPPSYPPSDCGVVMETAQGDCNFLPSSENPDILFPLSGSIFCYFKPIANVSRWGVLCYGVPNTYNNYQGIYIRNHFGTVQIVYVQRSPTGGAPAFSNILHTWSISSMPLGQWHSLTAVFDSEAGQARSFLDGVENGSSPTAFSTGAGAYVNWTSVQGLVLGDFRNFDACQNQYGIVLLWHRPLSAIEQMELDAHPSMLLDFGGDYR